MEEENVKEYSASESVEDFTLCYMSSPQDYSKSFLGAILVTDIESRPLHFAYITPVRPTTFQKILYGGTLKKHICVDVIGKKLFKEIPIEPTVVFVDNPDALPVQEIIKYPVACLSKVTDSGANSSNLSALHYETYSDSSDIQETVSYVIANLESRLDLLEPFARIKEALREAMKNHQKKN